MNYSWLVLLLLIACPVLMWLMMRGGHGDSHRHDPTSLKLRGAGKHKH